VAPEVGGELVLGDSVWGGVSSDIRTSHPILQGKPNPSHVCVRIKIYIHDRQ
jgi:hypothetical protein